MPLELRYEPQVAEAESHKLTSLPILLLNVHENCNCRCLMCDIWQRPSGSELQLSALMKLRDSLKNLEVEQVVLTGGEPLMHTEFGSICRFLKSCEVNVTLLTTGLLLAKRAKTVATFIDEVIISLDGPKAIHDMIRRVPRGFELIEQGIKAVRQLRPGIPIRARSTVQRANCLHLRATVAAARQLTFDSISFLATDVSSHAFNRELVWPESRQNQISPAFSEVSAFEQEVELLLEQYADAIAEKYITESPEKIRRIARRFREQQGELKPEAPICNAPWVSAVLEVDGTIRPCFFHPKVGSAREATLEDAINSQEAIRFRQTLKVAKNPTCQRCVCSLNYRKPTHSSSDASLP